MEAMLRAVIYEDAIASFGMLADDASEHGYDRDQALYLEAQRRARWHRSRMAPQGRNLAAQRAA